jgi:putative thioredoxin
MNTIIGDTGNGDTPMAENTDNGALVRDVDTASFAAEVIEASQKIPVIVDFWAPWCEPCKQLGPMLEKLVTAAGGSVRLVKINIDDNQQLAQQLRVQSVPMVYAFVQGRPLDGFSGALPESELKAFLDRVIEGAAKAGLETQGEPTAGQIIEKAKEALAKKDDGNAMQLFAQALELDDESVEALAGLARCYVAAGEVEAAQGLIDSIPEDKASHADVVAAKSALDLATQSGDAGETDEFETKLATNPDDHQARFDLAMARFAADDRAGAVDELLELVRRNREWNDGAARLQLFKMFDAWGGDDELTQDGRTRLSTLLFS